MNVEEKKKYLSGYQESKRAIRRLEEELKELEKIEEADRGPERRNMQQDIIKTTIAKERREQIERYEEVRKRIESITNEKEKNVLVYRHLQTLKWKDIEKKMGYERRQLMRIYNKALEHLKI